ncbi:MAG: L,D-transpeptidase family protein [Bacteroidetes bacterium]|nr:L,D-transpeptidase family protein [Bacteroidota bacterium]MBS1633600.1 L,D-transpeptidase family protein [Bacteroidota bacterium]
MKNLFLVFLICWMGAVPSEAQPALQKSGPSYTSFINYQKSFPRVNEAWQRKIDTLQKQFKAKDLEWPAKYIYIRSFKYDSQLEVWVKNELKEPFRLFKTYKVCALAGTLGPKRMEGDYQVPEGFYYINEFNPKSSYYLSLGINYPNASDRILSDSLQPGGEIYIHGSCVTVGCIPVTDKQIDEIYILAANAKDLGQDFIPVHIFPIRYDVPKSVDYLANITKDDASLKKFSAKLEGAFDYFEKYHQLPVVMIDDDGGYMIDGAPAKKAVADKNKSVKKIKVPVKHRVRTINHMPQAVDQWPQYPGGNEAFMKYLDNLGKEMVPFLPKGLSKAYVLVEFIIDSDGVPVNFKVVRGMNDEDFNDELISRMEKMPDWQPAVLDKKPVPKKMAQTVTVEDF